MNTFELSEDAPARRANAPAEPAPRHARGFFRRWMEAVREDDARPGSAGSRNSQARLG